MTHSESITELAKLVGRKQIARDSRIETYENLLKHLDKLEIELGSYLVTNSGVLSFGINDIQILMESFCLFKYALKKYLVDESPKEKDAECKNQTTVSK